MAKVLVAYFSYSGNAKKKAEGVANIIGADLFEIKTVTPYSSDYQECVDEARKELKEHARPVLADTVANMDMYEVVVLSFPNWCSTCPMPILSFVEAYDLSGKKIYSLVTNGGGGVGNSASDIKKSAAGATVTDSVNGNDLSEEQIRSWLADIL